MKHTRNVIAKWSQQGLGGKEMQTWGVLCHLLSRAGRVENGTVFLSGTAVCWDKSCALLV